MTMHPIDEVYSDNNSACLWPRVVHTPTASGVTRGNPLAGFLLALVNSSPQPIMNVIN